jgi:hypothetical protein
MEERGEEENVLKRDAFRILSAARDMEEEEERNCMTVEVTIDLQDSAALLQLSLGLRLKNAQRTLKHALLQRVVVSGVERRSLALTATATVTPFVDLLYNSLSRCMRGVLEDLNRGDEILVSTDPSTVDASTIERLATQIEEIDDEYGWHKPALRARVRVVRSLKKAMDELQSNGISGLCQWAEELSKESETSKDSVRELLVGRRQGIRKDFLLLEDLLEDADAMEHDDGRGVRSR